MHELELRNVSLEVPGRVLQVNVNLTLEPGGRVTLRGPSGCGKSSLIRLVLGFFPPAGGDVRVAGERLDAQSVWKARTRMAWVPQEPDLGSGTVREALDRPFSYHANRHILRDEEKLREGLRELNLPESILAEDPRTLSGGEKQRLALLAALQLKRPLLLLDEAVSALDPENKQRVAGLLKKQTDTAILAVSHDAAGLGLGERFVELEAAP